MDLDTSLTTTNQPAKRHETLWFSDGNVILATTTLLFRVHKGVLSFQSSVFRDMFTLPTTEDPDNDANEVVGMAPELYEGFPLVTLPEEGKDVEHLLKTIYDPRYYNTNQPPDDKFEALTRLTFKYEFRGIRANVMEHLARMYPRTLNEFEREGVWLRSENSIKILNCAVEAGIDDLFPGLYYACVFKEPSELRKLIPDTPAGRDALFRVMAGRVELCHGVQHIMSRWMGLTEKCIVLHKLKDSPYDDVSWEPDSDEAFFSDSLENVSGENLVTYFQYRVCNSCQPFVVKSIEDERRELWGKVPKYFDLGSWDIARTKLKAWMKNNA